MADTPEQKLDLAANETSISGHDAANHDSKSQRILSGTQSVDDEKEERLSRPGDKQLVENAQEREVVRHNQDDPPAEPPSEQPIQRVMTTGEDYSVLTVTQKKLIIVTASFASLFSPMATAIYCKYLAHSQPH